MRPKRNAAALAGPFPPQLDRVPGGFGEVVPPRGRGPPERPVRQLVHRPPWLLLEPVVMPALRAGVAQARSATALVRNVMFEVALGGGPPADRADTGGVPDLGQVPQPDPGVVSPGLEPVVAMLGAERVQL